MWECRPEKYHVEAWYSDGESYLPFSFWGISRQHAETRRKEWEEEFFSAHEKGRRVPNTLRRWKER